MGTRGRRRSTDFGIVGLWRADIQEPETVVTRSAARVGPDPRGRERGQVETRGGGRRERQEEETGREECTYRR